MFQITFLFLVIAGTALASSPSNGSQAKSGEFPWSGLLLGDDGVLCSCSLIRNDRVLTAAHCVASGQPGTVYFGSAHRGDSNEVQGSYNESVLHPKYNSSEKNAGYDVAVVKLNVPFQLTARIQPISLPTNNNKSYQKKFATATGYGGLGNGQSPEYLMKAKKRVLSLKDCMTNFSAQDDEKLVCTLSYCGADSGSGLAIPDNREWTLIGVASVKLVAENGGCDPNTPNGYVRVSEHLDFIKSV
jgi:V8-like Glu-specific endopeptidase